MLQRMDAKKAEWAQLPISEKLGLLEVGAQLLGGGGGAGHRPPSGGGGQGLLTWRAPPERERASPSPASIRRLQEVRRRLARVDIDAWAKAGANVRGLANEQVGAGRDRCGCPPSGARLGGGVAGCPAMQVPVAFEILMNDVAGTYCNKLMGSLRALVKTGRPLAPGPVRTLPGGQTAVQVFPLNRCVCGTFWGGGGGRAALACEEGG